LPQREPAGDQGNARKRFRERVVAERRAKTLAADIAFDLFVLSQYARDDGTLRGTRDGPRSWWDEKQLAAFLGWSSVKSFYTHWQRWKKDRWVEDSRPKNRGRMERWLVAERTGKP